MPDPVAIQRAYYRRTASQYDAQMQIEHNFSLQFMISMISYLDCHSVLDIGSGTGRTLLKLKEEVTDVRVCGIEPSPELRALAQAKGLTPSGDSGRRRASAKMSGRRVRLGVLVRCIASHPETFACNR